MPGAMLVLRVLAPVDKTLQAEELLGTAGFQLKMADTPAKLERISRVPQKQVVRCRVKDRELYLWADAAGCRCYYAGTMQNYEKLVQIRQETSLSTASTYDAQNNDPLFVSGDWEDELRGRDGRLQQSGGRSCRDFQACIPLKPGTSGGSRMMGRNRIRFFLI
jgi:hypothetical protein